MKISKRREKEIRDQIDWADRERELAIKTLERNDHGANQEIIDTANERVSAMVIRILKTIR